MNRFTIAAAPPVGDATHQPAADAPHLARRVALGLVASLIGLMGLTTAAQAQEMVEIGALRNDDIAVVQDVLYPKAKRSEFGGHLGWMPFDPLVTTPNAQFSFDKHFSESWSFSLWAGGGYGLKTLRYAELEGPAIGVAPYAFRYLGSLLAGGAWAPIYGKMAFGGTKVVHYDLHFLAMAGATAEASVIPGGGFAVSPTVSLGLGARFFVKENLAVRFTLRDDMMLQYRKLTQNWNFKQNAGITLGITAFTKAPGRR